ncbi:MAG: hypothetical protein IJM51_05515 [Clostridia bacterium]|nr:hypothetical protein [Clostridia bacterium]
MPRVMELVMPDFCQYEDKYMSVPYTGEMPHLRRAAELLNGKFNGYAAFDILDYPYCVRENLRRVYVRVSHISEITEFERELLTREEYAQALRRTINEKCVNCLRFVSEEACVNGDCGMIVDHQSGRGKIGRCRNFKPKGEPDHEGTGN